MTLEKFNEVCKLNCWEWDNTLPCTNNEWLSLSIEQKSKIISPIMAKIENKIGTLATSYAWWKFRLNKSEEEWVYWQSTGGHFYGLHEQYEEKL